MFYVPKGLESATLAITYSLEAGVVAAPSRNAPRTEQGQNKQPSRRHTDLHSSHFDDIRVTPKKEGQLELFQRETSALLPRIYK